MLTKFSVKNYKQFKEEITFDLTAGNYSFNEECVKDKTVKTALIYGANGTGKSSLGWAMFDLVEHLTDNIFRGVSRNYYVNALNINNSIDFEFQFQILDRTVDYQYCKDNDRVLLSERLWIDGTEVVNYELGKTLQVSLVGTEHLNKEINKTQNLSALKYILNNSNLNIEDENNQIFMALMLFIENMVWFQTNYSGMSYIGTGQAQRVLTKIISKGYLKEFESFLNSNGVECKLTTLEYEGYLTIAFEFGEVSIPFTEIASTGTKHLSAFFFWWIETQENNISLLFIDEFDSSYHFKLSANIVKKLKELPNTQVILTTHNTNLLNNDLIRPDCGFIIDGKQIKALQHCTKRELRHAHNLEKMYKAGAFNV